jgi:hypothetical protein
MTIVRKPICVHKHALYHKKVGSSKLVMDNLTLYEGQTGLFQVTESRRALKKISVF